ncbi:MAG: PQQ-binding-like beta-propeller repeat protein [Pseudomonadales bacterium]|nr:PQQ-binding-like beta-propeller repeat protein [Pseudomonadales bacterium]
MNPARYLMLLLCFCLPYKTIAAVPAPPVNADGERYFHLHCARCHEPVSFSHQVTRAWAGKSWDALLQFTHDNMPPEITSPIPDAAYPAMLAYLFRTGGHEQAQITRLQSGTLISDSAPAQRLGDQAWPVYAGTSLAQRYSRLDQINRSNVHQLQIAWRWKSDNFGPVPERKGQTTPIMVGGKLFATAGATRNVVALDAASGETLWMWRPDEGERFNRAARRFSGRGVAWWRSPAGEGRILVITPGYSLVMLDAQTGRPVTTFADQGQIDLTAGLRTTDTQPLDIGASSPPLVVGNTVIVGSAQLAGMRPVSRSNVKGDVRAYDLLTGKQRWTFHVIPTRDEPGFGTWENDSALYTGNTGAWAPLSADPALNLVYLPLECPTSDRYGGERPGDNLYANSVVALDVETGELRWYQQLIHHDIWDWDNPMAPILLDVPDSEGAFPAVVQLTKQAFAYVFDRRTGVPRWPLRELPVPASTVPGEIAALSQPHPERPPAYDRQGTGADGS